MKKIRLIQISIIGCSGGVLAWLFWQILLLMQMKFGDLPLMSQFIWNGTVIGAGIGVAIFSANAIISKNLFLLKKTISLGLAYGIVCSLFAFILSQGLLALSIPLFGVRIVAWVIFCVSLGLNYKKYTKSTGSNFTTVVILIVSGLFSGVLIEANQLLKLDFNTDIPVLFIIGGVFALSFNIIKLLSSNAFIRILTGENEGQIYLLNSSVSRLGYSENNDIILRGYSELCEFHAQIEQREGGYQIFNISSGGQIFVNYRFVDQQNMKNGDIVKIGSALLQYCEGA